MEIVEIEVSSDERHKGHGRRMLSAFFRLPQVTDAPTVFAITRASNRIAQQFYEACGFEVTGVLRRFYSREPAVVDAIVYGRSPRGPI